MLYLEYGLHSLQHTEEASIVLVNMDVCVKSDPALRCRLCASFVTMAVVITIRTCINCDIAL